MIVYIVSGDEYEQRFTKAVFSSEEMAIAYMNKLNAEDIAKGLIGNYFSLDGTAELNPDF